MKRLALVLGSAVALASAACRDAKQPPVIAAPSAADSADQVLYGVHFLLTTKGVQRGELFADTGYVMKDQTRFDFRKVRVEFTTETGVKQGTMRAEKAIYDLPSQLLEGWGNVVIDFVDGRSLKSPHVRYSQAGNDISSDTTYELSGPKGIARGIGFSADPGFTRYTCKRNCGGVGQVAIPAK